MKNIIRKLTRVGKDSFAIVLPANLRKSLGWRERQRLIVKRMPRGILIRDALTEHKK